jgi:2-C-methyl-D-erythritol 2,4-cyclodiphosphate synthase
MIRTGIGYDVHRLVTGRKLILGGVDIPYSHGLDGHSDADVLSHAIADAVLGAAGERDIGFHFPNHDESIRGISSLEILARVRSILKNGGATICNIDAMLIAEAPKVGPFVEEMRRNIATALGIPMDCAGIKATTNELLGFIGRGEGMAAMAVATVEKPPIS